MQRKFITNLALLVFLNLLVKPFWIFGIDRTVQNVVGAEEYGFYFALLNFTFLFNILLDLGITNFNNRNIARHQQLLSKHVAGIVSLRLILALLYLVVTIGFGLLAGYNSRQMGLLGMLAANQVLAGFILYLRSNISGLLMFRADSIISVLDRTLMILFCGLLLWTGIGGGSFRIEWFIISQTVAYLITALVAVAIVFRRSSWHGMHFNKAFSLMILKKSLPFALLILLMTIYSRIDAVLLERLIPGSQGAAQAGIYALAFRILDAVNQFSYLFAVLLLPLFSRMLGQKDAVGSLVRLSFTLLFTATLIISVHSALYSNEIMRLLYKANVEESAAVFRVLMWCSVPIATTYVFGTLLTANGNLFYLNIIAAGGVVLNLFLNLLLIPEMMSMGSAIAALSTQIVTAAAQLVLALVYFKFAIDKGMLFRLLVFVIGVVTMAWVGTLLELPWGQAFIATIVLSGLLTLILKLIRPAELFRIIRQGATPVV